MNPHELYTLREVAIALRLPLKRIRRWADTGRLDTLQNGRQSLRLVPASELERLNREGFYVDWSALEDLARGQNVQLRQQPAPGPYLGGMKPSDILTSEELQRVKRLKAQLADTRRAIKDARHRARFYKPDDATERRRIEEAQEAVIRAKAAERVGDATAADVRRAEEALSAVTADIRRVKAEAGEERQVLEAQRQLLEQKLTEAKAELEAKTAEAMRPAAARWLEALAAFVEANDALHAVEVELQEAGVPPVITAARDVTLELANSREHVLSMLRRNHVWQVSYAAELAQHRALATRTRLLKREHEAEAAAAARLAERQAKIQASITAQQAAQRRPRRNLFSFSSRGMQ